jgi:hypothetical protein
MKKQRERVWCVYWLYDDACEHPSFDGYIGCCSRLDVRLRAHRRNPGTYKGAIGVPPDFKVAILFRGPENIARTIEELSRPKSKMGWNRYRGGGGSPFGYKHSKEFRQRKSQELIASKRFKGIPKSSEQREKMRAAALKRYADAVEHTRTSKSVKRGLKDIDRSGANNPMFGRHMSEATKQKIRDKIDKRGGVSGANNPNWKGGV